MLTNTDSEANGLLHPWDTDRKGNVVGAADKVHCIDFYCPDSGEQISFTGDDFGEVWEWVKERKGLIICGHNIIKYDLPLWEKLLGFTYEINMETFNYEPYPDRFLGVPCRFIDTLILSQMLDPDRGGHAVQDYALKKGQAKVEIDDWDNLPLSEYQRRCSEDTRIQHECVYTELLAEARWHGDIRSAYEREKAVVHIVSEQCEYGVHYDSNLGEQNVRQLDDLMADIAARVEPLLPPRKLPKSKQPKFPAKPLKGDGSLSAVGIKFCDSIGIEPKDREIFIEECIELAGDRVKEERALHLVDIGKVPASEPMKMANQQDIKQWLIDEHGWEPFYWNLNEKKQRTTPKFHEQKNLCPHLLLLGDKVAVVKDIMLWLTYRNRRNVIRSENGTGLLHHPRLPIDGRIPASANTMGALTKRFTHKGVANVPRVSSVFGREMRAMFCVPDGRKLVGWDASNLEGRIKAHACYSYPGGAAYAEKLLDPNFDEHSENAEAWNVDRDTQAKSGLYCLSYGGKAPTFSKTLGVPLEVGERYHAEWWSRNEPLKLFASDLEAFWRTNGKRIRSIDGTLLKPRKVHALVNTWIQNAGAVVMKEAMVLAYREIKAQGIDSHQVIHYHDEQQNESAPECAELTGQIGVWSIEEAGRRFNLNVPMTAEYQIGQSWADTH